MSQNVNFLPPEEQSKKRRQFRTSGRQPQYTAPNRDQAPTDASRQLNVPQEAGATDAARGFFSRFAKPQSQAKKQSAPAKKPASKTADARAALLDEQKRPQKPPAPAVRPGRAKPSSPGFFERIMAWWRSRAAKKASAGPSLVHPQHATAQKEHKPAPPTPPAAQPPQATQKPHPEPESAPQPAKPEPPQPAPPAEPKQPEPAAQPEPRPIQEAAPQPQLRGSINVQAGGGGMSTITPLMGGQTFGTNLMRGQEFQFFDWQRVIVVMTSIAIFVVLATWGVYWVINAQSFQSPAELSQSLLQLRRDELTRLQEEVIVFSDLDEKTSRARALLAQHVYWSNFFAYLEEKTLTGVWYQSFAGDTSGVYQIKASALDFETFVQQLHAWKESDSYKRSFIVNEVILETGGDGETVVNFTIGLTVDPNIFTYHE